MFSHPSAATVEVPLEEALNPQLLQLSCSVARNAKLWLHWVVTKWGCVKECNQGGKAATMQMLVHSGRRLYHKLVYFASHFGG